MEKIKLGTVISKAKKEVCGAKSYPVLSITKNEGLVLQNERFKKQIASVDQSKYIVVNKGQLVLSIHMDEGVLGIQRVVDKGIVSPAYKVWNIDDAIINPEYLEMMMKSKPMIGKYKSLAKSSVAGRCNLDDKELCNILIQNIDIETQAEIVKIIQTVLKLIEDRKKELNLLEEFIKARFVEMFGDPVFNSFKWDTENLESICKVIVDCPHSTPNYMNDDTGYMCIRTSIVKKNKILWDEIEYISEDEYKKRIQRKRPEKGDIIYTREGAILGIAAVIDKDCNVALGQRSMLLSPNMEKCTPEFLSYSMNCESFLNNALKGQSGSASPHINVGDIKAFNMIKPPIDLQRQFSAFVAQVDKSKVVIQKALDEAQLLFDSLMQEYFG